jgi:hypothetical protein
MYFTTGNGDGTPIPPPPAPPDYHNAIVQIPMHGGSSVVGAYSPPNQTSLDGADQDLGSSRAIVVPGTNFLIAGSKVGDFYILDRTNPISLHQPPVRVCNPSSLTDSFHWSFYNGFAFWNQRVYTWCSSDTLNAFEFSNLLSGNASTLQSNSITKYYQGANVAVSASGTSNGIVWATFPDGNNPKIFGTGQLVAYNARNLAQTLYNSNLNGLNFQKFTPPVIAGGRVYVPTASRKVLVYGLGGK